MPSSSQLSLQPDPFDTSQFWPTTQGTSRSRYDIQLGAYANQSADEPQRYSMNNFTVLTSSDTTRTYNNMSSNRNNAPSTITSYGTLPNNTTSPYGTLPNYANSSALSLERNVNETSVAASLAQMSLDDRISESLNLRSKNTNSENIYSNSSVYADTQSTSITGASNVANDRYKDIPIYNNFEMNPAQEQFILETKDYYTKLSTPTGVKTRNDYEKNIYVPKYEDEVEKLQNFSDSLENSKNYSAMKYQNVDYSNYSTYSDYGYNGASTSRAEVTYDEVNDTASNFYSEIGEASNQGIYSRQMNTSVYDEVYEEATPRPHRPAPPCPARQK